MFEFIFGLAWTAFSVLFAVLMYSGATSTIEVNGELVTQTEFNSMLWPKLFIGLFILIGVALMITGLRKVIQDRTTRLRGEFKDGFISEIFFNGTTINGRRQYNALVAIVDDGKLVELSENIGFNEKRYRPGQFVKVQHYMKDINILERIPAHSASYRLTELVEAELIPALKLERDSYIDGVGQKQENSFENQFERPEHDWNVQDKWK